ncbi:CPBP family intramembrane glutamic endopeptidase, partial [Citrobacter freundii]
LFANQLLKYGYAMADLGGDPSVLNVFRSRYNWTMWLGALITSLLFAAVHMQYQNLLTLAEMFLVGLITSAARIRSGGLLLPVLLHMEATALGLLLG